MHSPRTLLLPLALLLALPLALLGAAPGDPAGHPAELDPSPAEARRLAAGEVLVEARHGPERPAEEVARGVIDAPPERVFAAVTDFAHYQEFMPFVRRSDAEPQPDGSVVSLQALELPPPFGSRHYKIRAFVERRQAPRPLWRTWWAYVPGSGNVAGHHGSWTLVEFGRRRTLGICRLGTDVGGIPVWAMNRGTAQTLPYIFSGLRQQVHRSRYDLR
jgi:uncharacterized protein YndB with AHSA1/START domain